MLVYMEGMFLKTKLQIYEQMTKFWLKIFGLIFALGVATGIVLEFEFGTNWANYSRYVGDIFGSVLAAEGIFAFFLESSFLALLLFGWNRVSSRMHFFATCMVCLGSILSAVWIVVANSWMQTPVGFHIPPGAGRAQITDFWAVVFNPSAMVRLSHVLGGALQAGAFLVLSISAYYVVRKKHLEFGKAAFKLGIIAACIGSLLQLGTGHLSAMVVSKYQPAKLAAIEAHFAESAPGDLYIAGWVDEKQEKVYGIAIPGMLSYLVHFDPNVPLPGLKSFPPENRPPYLQLLFQAYHIMVGLGMGLIGLSFLGLFLYWRGTIFDKPWLMWIFVLSVLGPQIANQLGWIVAEVGRQPWIVYNFLRTSDAVSPNLPAGQVWASLVLFGIVYTILFALFIVVLNHKIQQGPELAKISEEAKQA